MKIKYRLHFLLLILSWSVPIATMATSSATLIDLTHAFDSTAVYWPTEGDFHLEREHGEMTDKGYYYAANRFQAPEHGGTHIDAPIHFAKDRPTVDRIPLDRLIGPGIVVDVSANCTRLRDYQVSTADFTAWEQTHGRIPRDTIVLMRTGYSRYWPDRKQYLGTDRRGPEAIQELRFPGLHPQAAEWLVKQRHIKAVGIDTASIDFGQSTLFESHRVLTGNDVPIFENITDLEKLPPSGFEVLALPMKIGGGSGGPLRIIARVH